MSETNRPIKFSARLPLKLNEKLEKESEETGLSKNSVLVMALNDYFKQKEAVASMTGMNELLKKLGGVEGLFKDEQGGRYSGSSDE